MKQCGKCFAVKKAEEFVPRESKRDKWICKECAAQACAVCQEKGEKDEGNV